MALDASPDAESSRPAGLSGEPADATAEQAAPAEAVPAKHPETPEPEPQAPEPETPEPEGRQEQPPPAEPLPARRRWVSARTDVPVVLFFVLAALWVTSGIWQDPAGRGAPLYRGDPAELQFFLAHAVRVVLHGEYPFFTDRMNYPYGVNIMANTAMMGLGIPMIPVTVLFGAPVSFAVLLTLGLSGTATAWYVVLSRHVLSSRAAAAVGGWLCGFSPAMLSHAAWHPNIISQFLVPFIAWRVIALCRPGARPVRDGVVLGLLMTYQAFVNEEILLLTAIACGVFVLLVAAQQPGRWLPAWRTLAPGLGVGAVVAGTLLAYPLYVQFAGPQAYHGLRALIINFGNDAASYLYPGSATLTGDEATNRPLAPNFSEENAFFGPGLCLLVVASAAVCWRNAAARALACAAVLFALLSLGERMTFRGRDLGRGLWSWIHYWPLLDSVVSTRFGMIAAVTSGILVAFAVDRVVRARRGRRLARGLLVAGLAVALVPIAPVPVKQVSTAPVPQFITLGVWRPYVSRDATLVPLPPPWIGGNGTDGIRWAAATDLEFKIPGGYFLAPRSGISGDVGKFGGPETNITTVLNQVASSGRRVTLSEAQKRLWVDELRGWRAAILVLPLSQPRAGAIRYAVDQVAGPGRVEHDVVVWDVRALVWAPAGR